MSLASLIAALAYYKYLIIFPLAIVEGPVLMLACGFLVKLGYLPFYPAYAVLMAGDLVADIGWYAVGRYAARPALKRYGHFLNLTEPVVEKIERLFKKYDTAILFVSKITMGFGFALVTLVTAGAMHISFKKYAVFNFLGGFVWTAALMGLGYSLGNAYLVIDEGLRTASLVAGVVIVVAALYGANRALRKKLLKGS